MFAERLAPNEDGDYPPVLNQARYPWVSAQTRKSNGFRASWSFRRYPQAIRRHLKDLETEELVLYSTSVQAAGMGRRSIFMNWVVKDAIACIEQWAIALVMATAILRFRC